MNTREAYIEKMKAKLDEWDAEIAQMEARSRQAKADKQMAYNRHIAALKQHRAEAQAQYTEIQQAPDDTWEELKRGAEDLWARIGEAFTNSHTELDESKAA